MIADLTAWLWASLQLALPVFALPSFAVAVGCLVGGVVFGRATMAKDGLAVIGILRAVLIGASTWVMVWMLQLIYESWEGRI